MNQITEVITTLEHYKVVVRDTLEYTLPKEVYDVAVFKEKKRSVLVEIEQPTPLKSIIGNSAENGQKLEKLIREFYDAIYGDGSTILKLAEDGLRVDHAQHLAIFRYVFPIHENIEAMVIGIIADAKKNGIDVAKAEALDKAEERLYRAVAFLTLSNELIKLFGEYNQARREAKGEENAASKFIGNDINEVVSDVLQIRGNSHITDERYKGVEDKVLFLVEYMTGRRDLPMGKGFGEVIKETQDSINGFVREVEPAFREVYVPMLNELVEQAKKEGNKISATNGGTATAVAEPAARVGEFEEIDPKTGKAKKA
jgi:hypothetical protein